MKQLNEYGHYSWGFIFDYADRTAHETAKEFIWDCVTASANITFIDALDYDENYWAFPTVQFIQWNKIWISVRIETDDNRQIAVSSFLFIKIK